MTALRFQKRPGSEDLARHTTGILVLHSYLTSVPSVTQFSGPVAEDEKFPVLLAATLIYEPESTGKGEGVQFS